MLKQFEDNLLTVSDAKRLERYEIIFIAKGVLEVLQTSHEDGYVHTGKASQISSSVIVRLLDMANTNGTLDVKPDNILVNYGSGRSRFTEVELSDYGDSCLVDPADHLKLGESGHIIGAHMFRSPEVMLNLKWGTPTDIWSFGTTVRNHHFHVTAGSLTLS